MAQLWSSGNGTCLQNVTELIISSDFPANVVNLRRHATTIEGSWGKTSPDDESIRCRITGSNTECKGIGSRASTTGGKRGKIALQQRQCGC
jgi:hypothetical protein